MIALIAAIVVPIVIGSSSGAEPVRFLADDADVACRAILPQCFTREGWARLCDEDVDLRNANPTACQQASE